MYKKFVLVVVISLFMLGSTGFVQDKPKEKELDFADIQSTPEKTLDCFFDLYKKFDGENLLKIMHSDLHEQFEKMSEMKEFLKDVKFEFKALEVKTKDSISIASVEIIVISTKETTDVEVEMSLLYLVKEGEKWFIKALDEKPEDSPEWVNEFAKEFIDSKNVLRKFRKGQASPYFVVMEFVGSLAESDKETLKKLTISDAKMQQLIVGYAELIQEDTKVKTTIHNVIEKDDFSVCKLDMDTEGQKKTETVLVMKNEGPKELPNWKVIPFMNPELYLKDKEFNLPDWVKNWIKYCLGKTDEVKEADKLFPNSLAKFRETMLAGEYDKLKELLDKSQHEIIDDLKTDVTKITKFETKIFHVKGDEAMVFAQLEIVETGEEEAESDNLAMVAKFAEGKWLFFFDVGDEKMGWIDEIGEEWEDLMKNMDKANYRPSSQFTTKRTPNEYRYGNEMPENEVLQLELGKPVTESVRGYFNTLVNVKIEKEGIYRFEAKSKTEGGFVDFSISEGEMQIVNANSYMGLTATEVYLVPGNFTIQVNKDYNTPNNIEAVEFELNGYMLDGNNLPASCPKIELNKEYSFEDLNDRNGREFFYMNNEAGYYTMHFESLEEGNAGSRSNVTASMYKLPSKIYNMTLNLPSSKSVFVPAGLCKITVTAWDSEKIPTKFVFSKVETIKSGETKKADVPKNDDIGWQFKLDTTTRVSFEISSNASNLNSQVLHAYSTVNLQNSYGQKKMLTDILDPGIYMFKINGNYSSDVKGVEIKADMKPVTFKKSETKYESQTITGKRDQINAKDIEIDLSGYDSSQFVCIKVMDNATGMILPEAAIRIGKQNIEGMSNRDYTRMVTLGNSWGTSMNGKGLMYGYLLPIKYNVKLGVYAEVSEVKVEITLGKDIKSFEIGNYTTVNMKTNEISIYKVEVNKAKNLTFDALYLSSLGNADVEIWSNGCKNDQFTNWGSSNGLSKRGMYIEGTYYIVLKRVPRMKWMPKPEIEVLPVIISLTENLNEQY